jgi:hypothetical protein
MPNESWGSAHTGVSAESACHPPRPRSLSVEIPATQLEEAITTSALEVLKRFLAPAGYGTPGEGWTALDQRIRAEARSILTGRDFRPAVQEALDRVAPEVIEAVCRDAIAKAAARLLREKPGIVLEKAHELLGGKAIPAVEEVTDGR